MSIEDVGGAMATSKELCLTKIRRTFIQTKSPGIDRVGRETHTVNGLIAVIITERGRAGCF